MIVFRGGVNDFRIIKKFYFVSESLVRFLLMQSGKNLPDTLVAGD